MDGNAQLHKDILDIAMYAIDRAKPDHAVKRALERLRFDGDIYLVAVGSGMANGGRRNEMRAEANPPGNCAYEIRAYPRGITRRFMFGGRTSHSGSKQRRGNAADSPNDPRSESLGYRPVFALRRRQRTI